MAGKSGKKKSPFRHLLAVLYVFGADIVLFIAAVLADSRAAENAEGPGHPAPAWMIAALLILSVITVIVLIVAVCRTVAEIAKRKKEERVREISKDPVESPDFGEAPMEVQKTEEPFTEGGKKPMTKWKALRPLLLLPLKYLIDWGFLFWMASRIEPLPEGQLGFPLSGEFLLAVALTLVLSLILLIVVIILVVTRFRKLKRERKA